MSFSLDASVAPSTSGVNLSMLANTASTSGKSGRSSSAVSGPYFGGWTTAHPALFKSSSAGLPTASMFRVRAVISTFQGMAAECRENRLKRKAEIQTPGAPGPRPSGRFRVRTT
jgi:hypothetical protein